MNYVIMEVAGRNTVSGSEHCRDYKYISVLQKYNETEVEAALATPQPTDCHSASCLSNTLNTPSIFTFKILQASMSILFQQLYE